MTERQKIGIYFPLWRRVCNEMGWNSSDKQKRRDFHIAHGLPASSKDFNKTTHLDKFIEECNALLSNVDVRDRERERIEHNVDSVARKLGPAYVAKIMADQHGHRDPMRLNNKQLLNLLRTLTARARAQAKQRTAA